MQNSIIFWDHKKTFVSQSRSFSNDLSLDVISIVLYLPHQAYISSYTQFIMFDFYALVLLESCIMPFVDKIEFVMKTLKFS